VKGKPVLVLAAFLVTWMMAAPPGWAGREPVGRDRSLLLESRAAVLRALRYLRSRQAADGSWCDDPAITALVVTAMLGSGQEGFGATSDTVARALAFVRRFARPDGGIYDRLYPSYTTSICLMALVAAHLPQDRELVSRAGRFLLGLQADEAEGISPDAPDYGGWGYEPRGEADAGHRADLSNTQMALEAVRALQRAVDEESAAGTARGRQTHEAAELAFDKAVRFLQKCQNDDGGFIYRPGQSKAGADPAGGLRSYGSMTYAGLKSMIHARLSRDDPRVRAAYEWARLHWTVTENPGLRDQGLFYYYQTMARALNVYGQELITDQHGQPHDWRAELVGHLLKIQRADGSWVNANGRWMEGIPELVTAYAVLALEHATARW